MRFSFRAPALAAALATIAMCDTPWARADDGAHLPLSDGLVPRTELDDVSLSIIDEKLVLSLAVETHVQIEITEFALAGIQDEGLKQFTEKKLATYRRLYNTLDELSSGRATSTLARYVRPATTASAPRRAWSLNRRKLSCPSIPVCRLRPPTMPRGDRAAKRRA